MKNILRGIGGLLALFGASAASAQNDTGLWLSGGKSWAIGASDGRGWYGRFMASPNRKAAFVLSHSHLFFEDYSIAPNNDSASVKETNLEMGMLPDAYGSIFLGLGASRVQFDGPFCPTNEQQENCVGAGFVAEAVLALPWVVGLEARVFGNKNTLNDFMGVSVGLRFGSSGGRSDNAHASPPVDEVIPGQPQAPVTPPPRPAGPQAAPGKSAKLRPDAQARVRPQRGADGSIPAGATVTIKSSLTNNEGLWWYVEAAGKSGWARAEDLDVGP